MNGHLTLIFSAFTLCLVVIGGEKKCEEAEFCHAEEISDDENVVVMMYDDNSNSRRALSPVPQGFPEVWNGDRFHRAPCQMVQAPPAWLDGYLFAQLCASYGDQSNKKGHKVSHMFDAIGGMAVFEVAGENSTYTGAYYPTRSYKIWNFYDRDFGKSSVAWGTFFSTVNVSAAKLWDPITTDYGGSPPNVDFWKINESIIAGTETFQLGLTFDIRNVDQFRPYPFKDSSPLLNGQPLVPVHMAIHERVDPDTNLIWASAIALNISAAPPSLHQVIFTVDQQGVRHPQGVFDFASYDPSKCSPNGAYLGDKSSVLLPRYMHSITSTQNFVVLPMASVVMNPCQILNGGQPSYPPNVTLFDPADSFLFKFESTAPLTFLLFDKRTKQFLEPIEAPEAQFVTHQFNAYELSAKHLFVDMITTEGDAYDLLQIERLLKSAEHFPLAGAHALRFALDIEAQTVTNHSLLPQNPTAIEFPQFNHRFEGKQYKFGYAVTFPFLAGNQIVKIDMDTPTGINNKAFQPNGQSISLAEPYFVQRPGGTEEDDGVLVVRGLDASINKTRVYVLNAKTLEQVGEILAPSVTPFGFHERFYTKESLGLK